MELTERKNPYSFGLNAPELNALGKWKASDFAAKMEEKGLGAFYKSHKNADGFVTLKDCSTKIIMWTITLLVSIRQD
jgi:hypothetical protein